MFFHIISAVMKGANDYTYPNSHDYKVVSTAGLMTKNNINEHII